MPKRLALMFAVTLAAGLVTGPAVAADYTRVFALEDGAAASWLFHPVYDLPGTAEPMPHPDLPVVEQEEFAPVTAPVAFRGLPPTQRITLARGANALPAGSFTVETWVNDHVSGEIGLVLGARGPEALGPDGWALTYWSEGYANRAMSFRLATAASGGPVTLRYANTDKDGFKEYFRHIVGVYDGSAARLYVNGALVAEEAVSGPVAYPAGAFLEAAGHFEREPYMELGNFVRRFRLHEEALSEDAIAARFEALKAEVEDGVVYPGAFHLSAGPHLTYVDESSAWLLWETSEPATATLRWGASEALENAVTLEANGPIQEHVIRGLEPDTPYFYDLAVTNAAGETIETGLQSVRTATTPGNPFRFAVIGDTETRPHINQQISRLMWDERPSFVINLGDMTDGGREGNKFQWNYEYFVGVMPMVARVPTFSVPGNGEGNLYWYKRYHALPGEESPYTFSWGDADFFMLNSVPKDTDFVPGGRQYVWLEEQLAASDATWKFVALHYAPYTSEENDYGDSWREASTLGDPDVRPLVPLFEKYGVDIVMFGHLHLYERTRPMTNGEVDPDGVVYLLSGGAGGNLEDFSPNPAPFTVKTHRGHHYCTVDLFGDTLTLRMYDLEGALRDEAVLRKE